MQTVQGGASVPLPPGNTRQRRPSRERRCCRVVAAQHTRGRGSDITQATHSLQPASRGSRAAATLRCSAYLPHTGQPPLVWRGSEGDTGHWAGTAGLDESAAAGVGGRCLCGWWAG
ncbi:hypothetical protein E2C01_018263 [Portunus trituberculatus]|uniref:Uncharacterized protein n=1 Tax=Portunus trituberculatus TaxID=210409 RepID=A0A5B7DU26_PORTR|nr:hypothetical protein [Portunus trituberculatus]